MLFFPFIKKDSWGNSLAIQMLGLQVSTAMGLDSIPDKGTKIRQVAQHGQKQIKLKHVGHMDFFMISVF